MHDKFTERVRKVIYLAREEAARLQHDYIGTEHLLLGVIREGEGIAAAVLNNLGLDLDRIRQEVENMVAPSGGTMTIGEIPFTPRAKRVLELAVEEARASCAVENFRALSQTAGFQNYLAEMIQNYYTQAGAENGRIFLTLSESVAMKQNSFISASFPSHASQAIASIHTHYAGLAGIAPLFFLPSAVDIQAGVCAENQNNAILWGDVKLGFYLTVLDDQDSKLNEIIYERLRNEALGKPVDDFPLERYRQNTHNYKYYKLIPQGNRLRKGIAFSYALEEVPYPDEALAEIMQSLPEVNQRIWSVWKDEQKWTMLEESSGDNQLEFLKAERERILGAGLTEEAIQNPYPEHLKDLFDSELRSFMLERETKARKLRIEILDRLIEKQVPRPESGSNAYLPEQSI